MSQSSATVLFEDSYGFIWVGTPNGLNKYDGTDFEIFEESLNGKSGLTNGRINTIYEDGDELFIGTNHGVNVFDREMHHIHPFEFRNMGKGIESKSFHSIAKTNDTLWLGTYSEGLYRYDMGSGEVKNLLIENEIKVENYNKNYIVKIIPLDDDRLLVISRSNIFVISKTMEILAEIEVDTYITAVTESDKKTFLLGTKNGSLIELSVSTTSGLQTKRKEIAPGFTILSIAKYVDGSIWMGTENNGLFIYDGTNENIRHLKYSLTRPNSISSNSIWSLLTTRNGVLWMAPFKNGLSFYDPEYIKFKHIGTNPFNPQSLNNKLVNCFSEDTNGNIWIGTDGGGLNLWNRSADTFEHFSLDNSNFGSNVVMSLLQTEEEELWAGTWSNGITVFNTRNKTFKVWNTNNSFLKSNNVSDLLKDKKGRIWIISLFEGVQLYDPKTNEHKDVVLKSRFDGAEINSLHTIFEDRNGHIWIGTQTSGLFKLTERDGSWTSAHYYKNQDENSLSNDFVNTIVQDDDGVIWVGTQRGLNKYLPISDSFQSITRLDGLMNDAIKGIIANDADEQLWLSTEGGIIRFDIKTGETIDYDIADGLQSNEFNPKSFLTTEKGEYIFGGINGLNIFTPEGVEKRKDTPPLLITGLKLYNRPVLPNDGTGILQKDIGQTDSLTFDYDQSVFNFDFRALTYRHPEKVDYAYFLEGFETDWNYVGNESSATYTNINPGNYTLRIKSTNSDGIWVDNEANLHIKIIPPFWQTWWFKTLVLLFILLGLYMAHYIKIRTFKKNQRILERKIDERTKELQHQKDKLVEAGKELKQKNEEIQRFTYAVSHDLKSPLSNIKGIASLIPMEIVLKDFPNVEEYLALIDLSCNNMSELIADITEIAHLGKIENKNEILNTNEILDTAKKLIKAKLDISKTQLNISENLPHIHGDRKRIIQVFGNLLDNAIKYMGDQPNPTINVEYEDTGETNIFLIRDNGSGMDESSLKELFTPFKRFHSNVKGTGLGLYMIKKIMDSHGGTIMAASEGKGKGTTFKLIFPKAKIETLAG
ncbi:MAG: two-component regulator propeller domain-containing protein [Allomuricauda sp.]